MGGSVSLLYIDTCCKMPRHESSAAMSLWLLERMPFVQ